MTTVCLYSMEQMSMNVKNQFEKIFEPLKRLQTSRSLAAFCDIDITLTANDDIYCYQTSRQRAEMSVKCFSYAKIKKPQPFGPRQSWVN